MFLKPDRSQLKGLDVVSAFMSKMLWACNDHFVERLLRGTVFQCSWRSPIEDEMVTRLAAGGTLDGGAERPALLWLALRRDIGDVTPQSLAGTFLVSSPHVWYGGEQVPLSGHSQQVTQTQGGVAQWLCAQARR